VIFKELIRRKRDGQKLSSEEIDWIIKGFTLGKIPPYQMSAFLMAIYFQDLDDQETLALTKSMLESGETITIPSDLPLVDKHSTGGIGDKVSLVLSPVLAEMGLNVAMLSGRALGFTGGTADKLESTGMKVELTPEEIEESVKRFGFSISTQTENIAPADKKIYALRDATATVESIPLIVASILSKKLAINTESIVFDVKVGTGAFMKTLEDAEKLAQGLVNVSKLYGKKAAAFITEMSQPLGEYAGNALEVKETLSALSGKISSDLLEIVTSLCGSLYHLSNLGTFESGKNLAKEIILSGKAYERFVDWIEFWGGSINLPTAKTILKVKSEKEGWISNIDGERLGYLIIEMGGGRKKADDTIDYSIGLRFFKKIGDFVKKGDTIGEIYCNENKREYLKNFLSAYEFSSIPVDSPDLIKKNII